MSSVDLSNMQALGVVTVATPLVLGVMGVAPVVGVIGTIVFLAKAAFEKMKQCCIAHKVDNPLTTAKYFAMLAVPVVGFLTLGLLFCCLSENDTEKELHVVVDTLKETFSCS